MDRCHTTPTTLILPGQRLGHMSDFVAGEGTYIHDGHIIATLVGEKKKISSKDPTTKASLSIVAPHRRIRPSSLV